MGNTNCVHLLRRRLQSLQADVEPKKNLRHVVYIHKHVDTGKCYVGITIMEACKRWSKGHGYRLNPQFGAFLQVHDWSEFESYILCVNPNREILGRLEKQAIKAFGGHKNKNLLNCSPGGDLVADNGKTVIAYDLTTNERFEFASGSDAARHFNIKNHSMVTDVCRGNRMSVRERYFFTYKKDNFPPPKIWGRASQAKKTKEEQGTPIEVFCLKTRKKIAEHLCQADTAKAHGLTQGTVSAVAKGKIHSAKNLWFRFKGDNRQMPEIYGAAAAREKLDVPVYAYKLTEPDKQLKFRNATAAGKALGIVPSSVAGVTAGKRKSDSGWFFSTDPNEKPPTRYGKSAGGKTGMRKIRLENMVTGEVTIHDSGRDAAAYLNASPAGICKAAKLNRPLFKHKVSYLNNS